jgi:hypothetical protein
VTEVVSLDISLPYEHYLERIHQLDN